MAEQKQGEGRVVFSRPKSLLPVVTNYCPGCPHGIVHRLVAEVIDELDIEGRTVGVAPVGCAVTAPDFFGCDMIEAAHGRAPAVATGVKRVLPGNVVFAYQGDGDLASIGMAETVHAATRGEHITVIFINNAIYGMTGGQMAPTSLPNQVTQTSPYGRDVSTAGYPVRVCELLSSLDGPCAPGQARHQEGVPEPDRRHRLFACGSGVHVPHELGSHAAGQLRVDAREHAAVLSAGRVSRCGCRWVR